MREFLDGKKTYLIGLSAIIGVALGWINGNVTDFDAIQSVIGAILAMTVKASVRSLK